MSKSYTAFFVAMTAILVTGCAGQQISRTVSHEPILLEEECRIRSDGTEECRPATSTTVRSDGSRGVVFKPRIPSEIGAAVGKADAARRLAAAEIIAACLDTGGRSEACAQAASPYSGVAGSSSAGATGYGYQGQIQPYRGQQQRPRGCQSTWSMFPSLC